ncbi:MAG: hypothetical protein HY344_01090 [Candidatus Levybacteria bacterium]|nr:hypothetical protein [Candidatus Levybacteria bacterium]
MASEKGTDNMAGSQLERSKRSKGASIERRRKIAAAKKLGSEIYVAPPTPLSPKDKLQRETYDSIRKMPRFKRDIKPHMGIVDDFWSTRMSILNGADRTEAMNAFIKRHPVMETPNPISEALAPATTLIRDKIEGFAKLTKR